MRVTVIGAGAGGASAAVELTQAGCDVALWNRSPATLAPFQAIGGIEYEGVLGSGRIALRTITGDITLALKDTEAVVCTLPTFSHAPVARMLAGSTLKDEVPIILNPGHTGGALEFRAAWRTVRNTEPLLAEFSTLTYVARKYAPQKVTTTGRAKKVRVAGLPGTGRAVDAATKLFPNAEPVGDVLNSSLSNVNMILHPPGAILGAAWVEATGGDFTFYVQGMTPAVARVMTSLDDERRSVATAFGISLPNLIGEMQRIGTVEASVTDTTDFRAAISGGEANSRIRAPGSLAHRYYLEDFGHGMLPFMELAAIAGVGVPTAASLFTLARTLTGTDYRSGGRTAEAMGIAGRSKQELLKMVRA